MTSSKQQVKNLFGGRVTAWAAFYSNREARTLEARNLISRQRFALEMVEAVVPRASKVLDVGCGTGEMVGKLMRREYEVWGLDIAEPMIRYARDRCASDRFEVGDIEHIPFADNTFDAVVCLGVIEYLDTDEHALREIRRVLKPGGRAVVSTPSAICPLHHLDRVVVVLMAVVRPVYDLVKYRLRGRRAPVRQASRAAGIRRCYRRRWLRLLRSVGLEPEEWISNGWGWYESWIGLLAQSLSRTGELLRGRLERFFGRASLCRASGRFVRSRAFNWLAAEHVVRLRVVK